MFGRLGEIADKTKAYKRRMVRLPVTLARSPLAGASPVHRRCIAGSGGAELASKRRQIILVETKIFENPGNSI
jgi:hypothetical protein